MLAHAAHWAVISAGGSAPAGTLVACMFASALTAPVVDRLHLPFAAVAFSAVVSLMPGFFLFNTATGLVELVSIGPGAPAALVTSIAASSATALLIITAMAFGLILPAHAVRAAQTLPRMIRHGRSMHRSAIQD